MSKVKVDKNGLLSLINDYEKKINDLSSYIQKLYSTLSNIKDDADITGVSSKASSIASSFRLLNDDYKMEVDNLKNYVNSMIKIDETDPQKDIVSISKDTISTSTMKDVSFEASDLENKLSLADGKTIVLPAGLGTVCTYMGWQCITSPSSNQYKLREAAGMNFDSEGYGKINDRFVIATTTTYGNVGDYLDVKLTNGNVIKCVIGDIKSRGDAGCNEWGHQNGNNVIEFVVDRNSWYGKKGNPSISDDYFVSERTGDVVSNGQVGVASITNKGNYFDYV